MIPAAGISWLAGWADLAYLPYLAGEGMLALIISLMRALNGLVPRKTGLFLAFLAFISFFKLVELGA